MVGVISFLFFNNLKIKNSKAINTIVSSTFGVLQIHANSDTMRRCLWKDVVNVEGAYSLSLSGVVIRSVLSAFIIFSICIVIDQIRVHTVEKWLFNL